MNIPNFLTICRIILTFIFIYLFTQDSVQSKALGFIVFTLASLTDCLDGYIARKYNLISRFGKIMDPIADKFLVLSAFFIVMQMQVIAAWMFILIAAREVIITGLRLFAVFKGITLAAERAGKLKTVLQIISVYLIMITIILNQWPLDAQWYHGLVNGLFKSIYSLMLVVVLITLWSGLSFILNNQKEILRVG